MKEEMSIEEMPLPSKTYRMVNHRVVGMVDHLTATQQAIEKIIQTERFSWPIYSDSYGSELTSLVGEPLDLVELELSRLITEAVITDDRVLDVTDFIISDVKKECVTVQFTVNTIFGKIPLQNEVML
ncbi:DUF2634 domain-containing protein [Enterococcus sp. DIV1420a]|uniref:DUF2634 domain-containing protein n=1 Tax=Enterococcus sp. DIV1420a TaxID=2774672 RepID=UPI003F29AFD2